MLLLCSSLFYNKNSQVFAWGEKEKCVVDPVIETKYAEFPKGKIPIGETTDETEDFAQKIIDELENIYNEGTAEVEEALAERDEAELEIEAAWKLIDLTGPDSCKDCADTPCDPGDCNCIEIEGICVKCSCTPCTGEPCPMNEINNTYNEIENHYNNIEDYYNSLEPRPQNIADSTERIINLIEAENLSDEDPNRWKILNKLLNSRVKLEECLIGYEFALKETKTNMRTLSCEIALDKIYLGELNILGYFEDKIIPFPHCYPYYASETSMFKEFIEENIQPICETNKDSLECREAIRDFMDNYFCCEGK